MLQAEAVGMGFSQLADALLALQGHVVLTGVGKSGLIARKIAATFSSTGTPAVFLDPTSALHGDLGLLKDRDLLMALSNSGETAELLAVVRAARGMGVLVSCVTAQPQSTVAKLSHYVVRLAVEREACPMGLAPTSSTTAMLAIGDALALAVSEARGFTRDRYLTLHPGGSLGERLRYLVRDVMQPAVTVKKETSLVDALRAAEEAGNPGILLVVDDGGDLLGVITDGDVRRALADPGRNPAGLLQTSVVLLAKEKPWTVSVEASAADALRLMEVHGVTALPVRGQDGKPLGLVHIHGILGRGTFTI